MKTAVPSYFKSILWEYDMTRVDPDRASALLTEKAINYGDLRHWRWLAEYYGAATVRSTLMAMRPSEIRPGARALAAIVFSLPTADAAPLGDPDA